MLKLDTQATLSIDNKDIVYWGDTSNDDPASPTNTFYLWPDEPRLRHDDQGVPVIKLYKYTSNVTLPNGAGLQGGYLIFDVEFALDPATVAKAQAALKSQHGKDVIIGTIPFTDGKVNLHYPDGAGLVNELQSTGKPSLSGSNIASLALALTPQGATLFDKSVIESTGASSIQIIYSLSFDALLPAIKAHVWYNHTLAQDYYKKSSNRWNTWKTGYDLTTSVVNDIKEAGAGGAEVDFTKSNLDPKAQDQVRTWAQTTLTNMITQSVFKADTPNVEDAGRGNTVDYQEKISQSTDFDQTYNEKQAVNYILQPSITLTGLAGVQDNQGNPISVDHFLQTVDLTDNIFGYLIVAPGVNFANWDLVQSVTITLQYGEGLATVRQPFTFANGSKPQDPFKQTLKHDSNNNPIYTYSYQVEAAFNSGWPKFESDWIESEDTNLSIGLYDLNVLSVKVIGTSLDWTTVTSVDVDITCQGVTLDHVNLNKSNTQQVIANPMPTKPVGGKYQYDYTQTFHLASGAVFTVKGSTTQPSLYVTSPFPMNKTVTFVADQDANMSGLYLTLEYVDSNDNYKQEVDGLNIFDPANKGAYKWIIPTPQNSSGDIFYSGSIIYNDGTPQKDIPRTQAPQTPVVTVYQGKPRLTITVETDLVDWSQFKLIKVNMSYPPSAPNGAQTTTLTFKSNTPAQTWTVSQQDRSNRTFSYQATYFTANNKKYSAEMVTVSDSTDVELEPPATSMIAANAVALTTAERALF